jgi:hypothetical protein
MLTATPLFMSKGIVLKTYTSARRNHHIIAFAKAFS